MRHSLANSRSTPVRARRAAGFTLIEVLVVVVILGILAAFIVPNLMDKPGQARMTKAHSDIRAIESALNMYRLEKHNYPTTDQGLEILVPAFLPHAPIDPWNRPYQYLSPGTHGQFDLFSLGRDGQPGGEGEDADITNWTTPKN
ncbi:MAG: type II secretion system major pseudopilin GspG [Chromatiales bacterium]|jgi:general secretion pathway protein G|nr:type II secretion system major pseudopilin GspG [Chromatiales bacterium]